MPPASGLQAISETFQRSKREGRASFMPFFTVGYPDYATSIDALEMLANTGADALEVGMPFSDPLADGPVIQSASQVALNNGTRIHDCIEAVRELRKRGVSIPLVMMGYINPLLAYGIERFVSDAAEAGASAFIIPDLPLEEVTELTDHCDKHGLGYIPLLAPNSPPNRVEQAAAAARGFIYLVSVMGVTGARESLPEYLANYVGRIRMHTQKPLVVGFGVSKAEHANQIAHHADGVVVASALLREMDRAGLEAVRALAASLRAGCYM
ncbi:MAG: tryptophan synthase subunit alpha [Anaerolineae bacterium]